MYMVGMVTFGQKRYPAIEGQKINFDMMIIGEKTGGWSTHRTEQRFFYFIHLKKKSKFVKFLSYATGIVTTYLVAGLETIFITELCYD